MRRRLALAALVAAALACNRDPHGMLRQPRGRPYRGTPVFPDGRMMRTPPEGTVPRSEPDVPDVVRTGLEHGKPVERFPIRLTAAILERGRHDFQIFCAACHGLLGDGRSVVATKMALRPPPSITRKPMPPGHVYRVILLGYGLMPDYAADIGIEARWGVAAYLEALRRSQNEPESSAPEAIRRMLEGAP